MSNVLIAAIGEVGLSVAVNLGSNERKVHECPAGESIELTVGGNQTLKVSENKDTPTAEAEVSPLPTGADIVEGGDSPAPEPAESGAVPASDAGDNGGALSALDVGGNIGMGSDTPVEVGDPLKNPFDEKPAE